MEDPCNVMSLSTDNLSSDNWWIFLNLSSELCVSQLGSADWHYLDEWSPLLPAATDTAINQACSILSNSDQ